MSLLPTACPRCNSDQEFIPKMRESDHGWLERYIRCSMCHYEQVIGCSTPEIEKLSIKVRKFAERADYEIQRFGTISGTLARRQRETRKQRSTLITELYARVREVNGTAPHPDPA